MSSSQRHIHWARSREVTLHTHRYLGTLKCLFITDHKKELIDENIRFSIKVPSIGNLLSPILLTIPIQLLAYHVALLKNCDIDKPRNLAKSVTVE